MATGRKLIMSVIEDFMFNNQTEQLIQHKKIINDGTEVSYLFALALCYKCKCSDAYPIMGFYEQWVANYIQLDFTAFFRMDYVTFHKLLQIIMRNDPSVKQKKFCGGHTPVPSEKALMVFLWYLSKQETLISIGQRFGIVPSTVLDLIKQLLNWFIRKRRQFIFWPKTQSEIQSLQQEFTSYPHVIGAIDGTHIKIKAPATDQDSYLDRNHRHTINVLAVCTKKKFFTYVNVGWPGSAHDSRVNSSVNMNTRESIKNFIIWQVLQNSELYKNMEGPTGVQYIPRNCHIIGDSAFPCLEWLLTPYSRRNLTREEKHHNTCLSHERVVIENAFGLLKGRWRILQYVNVYSIPKAVKIIVACCALHNFCLLNNDICEDVYEDSDDEEDDDIRPIDRQRGIQKRDQIKRMLARQRQ